MVVIYSNQLLIFIFFLIREYLQTNKAKEEERNRLEERDRKNSEVAMKWKGRADKMKEEWEMVISLMPY